MLMLFVSTQASQLDLGLGEMKLSLFWLNSGVFNLEIASIFVKSFIAGLIICSLDDRTGSHDSRNLAMRTNNADLD